MFYPKRSEVGGKQTALLFIRSEARWQTLSQPFTNDKECDNMSFEKTNILEGWLSG